MDQHSDPGLAMLGFGLYVGAKVGDVLIEKIVGPAVEGVAAPLIAWRDQKVANAKRVYREAAATATETGLPIQAVPGRLLWPILEKSSIEEDETLQSKWATLLASAAVVPEQVLPSFPSILSELSPLEVRLLDRIDNVHVVHESARTDSRTPDLDVRIELTYEALRGYLQLSHVDYALLIANLQRMNLILSAQHISDKGHHGENWTLTILGGALVNACSKQRLLANSAKRTRTNYTNGDGSDERF